MRLLLLLLGPLLSLISCQERKDDGIVPASPPSPVVAYDWAKAVDSAQTALTRQFWAPGSRTYLQDNAGNSSLNYWWQAHALDVLADGLARTNNPDYSARMAELLAGLKARNNNTLDNDFYDDMEWLALASLRAAQLTSDARYRAATDELWGYIKTGWSEEHGGGISWKKTQRSYKNTPANAPACILAARLYQLYRNPDDLVWAQKIYQWQKTQLVDPATGLVWDGLNRQGNGQIDKDWVFTYNQGVFIGAALEMFKATGQASYLDDAQRTATYVINNAQLAPGGVLKDEGNGDGGLFKGILVRYLAQLLQDGNLPTAQRRAYGQFLLFNGNTLLRSGTRRPAMLFNTAWTTPSAGTVQSSVQLSGMMLLEALARLKSQNLLP